MKTKLIVGNLLLGAFIICATACGVQNSSSSMQNSDVQQIGSPNKTKKTRFVVPSNQNSVECFDLKGNLLPLNNQEVINWKHSTKNQYLSRGHISGIIGHVYSNKSGHTRFQIKLGEGKDDTVEAVYNVEFGGLPKLVIGMKIEACGDYITSNQSTERYPKSPDDAILHWIHKSCSPKGHKSGFIMVNGTTYGQDNAGCR